MIGTDGKRASWKSVLLVRLDDDDDDDDIEFYYFIYICAQRVSDFTFNLLSLLFRCGTGLHAWSTE